MKGGKGNEKFWNSRRIKGAILSGAVAIAVFLIPENYELILVIASGAAAAFGITSWIKPKKNY